MADLCLFTVVEPQLRQKELVFGGEERRFVFYVAATPSNQTSRIEC